MLTECTRRCDFLHALVQATGLGALLVRRDGVERALALTTELSPITLSAKDHTSSLFQLRATRSESSATALVFIAPNIDAHPIDTVFMIPCLHAHDKTRSSRSVLIADS